MTSNETTLGVHSPGPSLLTLPEAAAYLRVSRTTVYRMVRRRELPHCRIGAQLRFLHGDVNEAATRRRVPSFHEYARS